jgi:ATP/maltotriose-dependent transcriptional regulator MalT
MLNKYESFEIRFLDAESDRFDIEASCDLVGEAHGVFRSPGSDPLFQHLIERLQALDTDESMLITLGRMLFDALFQDDIRLAYVAAQNALSPQQGLRLCLTIAPSQTNIAQLPWELLCAPDNRPLVMLNTPIVRYLRMLKRPPVLEAPQPINVLVTAALTAPLFEVERELQEIRGALKELEEQQLVSVHFEEHITRRRFQRLLRQDFHIWHFIGHGTIAADRMRALLLFEDDTGAPDACSARELSILLEETSLQLVILNACSSAQITATPFGSIAPALMQTDVSAVIAMQFKFPQEAAQPFYGEFYRSLAAGDPIDACVTEGRKAIMGVSGLRNPDWGIPVVYTRAPSGQLFKVAASPEPAIEDPPPEVLLPPIGSFVGRTEELVRFSSELRRRHLVVISGLPGVGKTVFGLALANTVAPPANVFWFTLSNVEGIDALIHQLAAFLAHRGNPAIWTQLEHARTNNIQPPSPSVLFNQLLPALRGRSFLLCVDAFHLADDDPLLKRFGDFIVNETSNDSFDCIIISRTIPLFVHELPLGPLPGLTVADTQEFLHAQGLDLPQPLLASLHAKTAGTAALLVLALSVLRKADDMAHAIAQLDAHNDIERYLFTEVDDVLSDGEREIMHATSILNGDVATRELIETLCDGRRVKRDILALNDRFLLDVVETDAGEVYRPHAMLQAFYYDELSKKERAGLHLSAAAFYEEDADLLRAAIHFRHGGSANRAASLATENVVLLLNRGQSRALAALLDEFTAEQLDAQQWIEVLYARGRVYMIQRRQDLARQNFLEALHLTDTLPAMPTTPEAKARIYCNLGELLRTQKPREALEWLKQGIAVLDNLGAAELTNPQQVWKGRLLSTMGGAYYDTGDYQAAVKVLRDALRILPDEPTQWRGTALNSLGSVYLYLGDLDQAYEYFEQARLIYQQFHSYWRITSIWLNLGLIDELRGQWDTAAEQYTNALQLARSAANLADQTLAELNLGNLFVKRGDIDAALAHLHECLELSRAHQLDSFTAAAQSTLADLHVRLGDWEHGAPLALEAQQIAIAADARYVLPETYRSLAQMQPAPRERLRLALCSAKTARQLHDPREIGMSLRAVGQARLALGQVQPAIARLERSLALLSERDAYETARTKQVLGVVLHDGADAERGAQLLGEARSTFEQLGARLDLAKRG